jgi:hydroxyacylglutathione hydrolase
MRIRTRWLAATLAVSVCLALPLVAAEDIAVKKAWDKLPSAERWFKNGLREFEAGRRNKAAAAFEKCLGEIPRHAFARYYLANIAYIAKDMPRALADMDRAVDDLGFMESLYDYALGQKSKTFDSYKKMMSTEWDSTTSCRTHRELESLFGLVTDEEKKQSLQIDAQKAARARQRAHYLYFRGNIFYQLKRLVDAARDYEQALALNPRHANAYNNLAAIRYLNRDYLGALDLLEEAERRGLEDNLNLKLRHLVNQVLGRSTIGILEEEIDTGAGQNVLRFALATRSSDPLQPPLYENGFLLYDRASRSAVLIDPGVEDPRIDEAVQSRGLMVKAVLCTHGHEDHVGGAGAYAALYGVPVLISAEDAKGSGLAAAMTLRGTEILDLAGFPIRVIPLPGHTPGSLAFLAGRALFSGDTLFKDGVGLVAPRDDATGRRLLAAMVKGIKEKLLVLPHSTYVFPGHGRMTTIATEKAENTYLK